MPRYSPVKKSQGVTPAERYLRGLCDKTFLSLWSYPSLYRDQRIGPKTEGKEVSDLLVVFENDIIIFSDKHCLYPSSPNAERNWARWFKRAVKESAAQGWGAERWIRSFPERLFLDAQCTQRFPLELPANPRFHLIVVAHDASRVCKETLGGSGSLMLQTDRRGFSQHTQPFIVGDLAPSKTFVHVLDDTSLAILMDTLDTIADFAAYLRKKEALFRGTRPAVMAAGEEELLAWYLKHTNGAGEHDFVFPPEVDGGIALMEGGWLEFQTNPQRLAQIEHDRDSYMWDALIETFNVHALNGTQYRVTDGGIRDSERVMRFCARESRTRRRYLAGELQDMLLKTTPNQARRRLLVPTRLGDPHYVFLLFPYDATHSDAENRQARGAYLEACLLAAKVKCPDATDIVGIATESGLYAVPRTEDAIYLDTRDWTPEMQANAEAIREEFEIFVTPDTHYAQVKEYPTTRRDGRLVHPVPKNPRNKPCPCESGKKYKKCHGRNAS